MLPHRDLTGRILAIAASLSIAVATVVAQQPPPQPAARPPQAPPRSPYQEAGQLPARIMSFTAEPQTIKPGESVTLKWAVENPRTTTIEPTVGRAVPAGEIEADTSRDDDLHADGDRRERNADENGDRDRRRHARRLPQAPSRLPLTSRPAPRTTEGKPDLTGVYGYGVGTRTRRAATCLSAGRASANTDAEAGR